MGELWLNGREREALSKGWDVWNGGIEEAERELKRKEGQHWKSGRSRGDGRRGG